MQEGGWGQWSCAFHRQHQARIGSSKMQKAQKQWRGWYSWWLDGGIKRHRWNTLCSPVKGKQQKDKHSIDGRVYCSYRISLFIRSCSLTLWKADNPSENCEKEQGRESSFEDHSKDSSSNSAGILLDDLKDSLKHDFCKRYSIPPRVEKECKNELTGL